MSTVVSSRLIGIPTANYCQNKVIWGVLWSKEIYLQKGRTWTAAALCGWQIKKFPRIEVEKEKKKEKKSF